MTTAKNIYDFINGFAPFETQVKTLFPIQSYFPLT